LRIARSENAGLSRKMPFMDGHYIIISRSSGGAMGLIMYFSFIGSERLGRAAGIPL
jgi:hypothetical protein